MTALDQAFIRAFSQQGAVPVVLPRQAAAEDPNFRGDGPDFRGDCPNFRVSENGTVPLSATIPLSASPSAAAAAKAEPRPAVSPTREAAPPISDVFRNVLATLEKPPVRPETPEKAEAPAANTPWRSEAEADVGSWNADWWQSSVGMAEPFTVAEPNALADSVGLAEPIDLAEAVGKAESTSMTEPVVRLVERPVGTAAKHPVCAAVELPVEAAVEQSVAAAVVLPRRWGGVDDQQSTADDQQSAIDNQQSQSPVAPLSSFPKVPFTNEPPAPVDFKPAWQVERFTWPRVCRRLMARAAEEFDRLADALLAAHARGQKVLAMAGCCRGEGATTLLLCAARRLAERGVKLVLVDADLSRPRLAKRLGVQPQAGWNELSGEDETFLVDAVVEAAANNLALSGIREPASPSDRACNDWSRLAPCIETLKSHYEMVLVDLGPLENIKSFGDAMGRTPGGKIDAVLLVHNPRITSEARLDAIEQQLTESGVALAGLIENFVAS